jgi:hypothetical protein
MFLDFVENQSIAYERNLNVKWSSVMPSNYIPWGGPGPEDKRMRRIHEAGEKIKKISTIVANRKKSPVEKGPL